MGHVQKHALRDDAGTRPLKFEIEALKAQREHVPTKLLLIIVALFSGVVFLYW